MVYGYYLFILVALIFIIVCAICACCLRVRRRHNAEAAAAEQNYQQFANNANNNNNNAANNFAGGVYVQGTGQGGDYGNMYYQQQQQQQSPQVGVVGNTGAGMYYPGGNAGPNGGGGPRPLSATVLYATPAGAEGGNVNFGSYFPEAQLAGGFPNTNNASNTTDAAAAGMPRPSESSPYGEADYVSRPPLQQTSNPPPPLGGGNAMLPPPQYPAASPTRPSNGNIIRFGGNEGAKGKELD